MITSFTALVKIKSINIEKILNLFKNSFNIKKKNLKNFKD